MKQNPEFRVKTFIFHVICLLIFILPQVNQFFMENIVVRAIYLFLLSYFLTYSIVPLSMRIAWSLKMIDHPSEERKMHQNPTPRTGGIAIFLGFIIVLFFNFHFSFQMKLILISGAILFLMGIVDDWKRLPATLRFGVQLAIGIALIVGGVRISFIPDWMGGIFTESIITLLWILGITNAMNFIDGIDGLAAGVSVVCGFFFALCAMLTEQTILMYLAVVLAGSSYGFLPFNLSRKRRAAIFMGDSGSTFLGFTLASLALIGDWGTSVIDLATPILIMSVLIFDTSLTTIVRILRGQVHNFKEWLAFTGRDHFHHRLIHLGLSSTTAVYVIIGTTVCFGLAAIAVLFANWILSIVIIAHSVLAFGILGIVLVLGSDYKLQQEKIVAANHNKDESIVTS